MASFPQVPLGPGQGLQTKDGLQVPRVTLQVYGEGDGLVTAAAQKLGPPWSAGAAYPGDPQLTAIFPHGSHEEGQARCMALAGPPAPQPIG